MVTVEAQIPDHAIIPWLQKCLETMQKTERFVNRMYQFRARKTYTPLREDGTIDEKSPVYRILCDGTQEEADAGMFVSGGLINVTPWSLMPFGEVSIEARHFTYINGVHVVDPNQYALAYICNNKPAQFIFASRDTHGECADFFFPIDGNVYIRVTVNARYSDVRVYGFEGDPTAFAATVVRRMRVSEWDLRENGAIPVQICPTTLPLEYKDDKWQGECAVTLADIMTATQVLKRLPNERGEPYLVG